MPSRIITYLPILFCILTSGVSCTERNKDSLDVKIGQMILVGTPGTEPDSALLEEVRQGRVGSILLFEKNIAQKDSYNRLRKMIQTYQKAAPIPLFIAIDQEGGKVNRLKEKYGFPKSLSAASMGRSIDSVRFYGKTTASTLVGLNINTNFAPVVDLAVNPNNPIIAKKERAFSENKDSVAYYAKAFIQTHRKAGVFTVLKHFPGHGSSAEDTHKGMADVTDSWSEDELKPYKVLIDSGYADMIMTAHIVNRKLDESAKPGTLSKNMVEGLLRKKLGYEGVVVSDDMQMHAITKYFGLEEAIRLSINAGIDILIFSNNISDNKEYTIDRVHSIIRSFVERGMVSEERIDQSFRRIGKLKKKLNR